MSVPSLSLARSFGAPLKAGQPLAGLRRLPTVGRLQCPSIAQCASYSTTTTAARRQLRSSAVSPSSPHPRAKLAAANNSIASPSSLRFYSSPSDNMAELKVGDSFPDGVTFQYVPYTPESGEITACGVPQKFDASTEFKNKKVVIVSVPGAFTPTCSVSHIPSFIENADKLKAKGVDQVVVIAYNDAWVMSAWGKSNGIKDDWIIFASDVELKFSKSIGWTLGERTARYAIVVDHGKVTYAAKEAGPGSIEQSGAEAVLAKL